MFFYFSELVEALVLIGYNLWPLVGIIFYLVFLQKFVLDRLIDAFGAKAILLTGIVGVTLHEIAHFIMCIIFGVRVRKVQLYNYHSLSTLGYVQYSYNKYSTYQLLGLFFIGYAPFILSFGFFWGITYLLLGIDLAKLPYEQTFSLTIQMSLQAIFKAVVGNSWSGLLWVFCAVSVLIHMLPSKADLKGARVGEVCLIIFLMVCLSIEFLAFGLIDILPSFLVQQLEIMTMILVRLCALSTLVSVIAVLVSIVVRILLGSRLCRNKTVGTTPQF